MEKKEFLAPTLEVVELNSNDVICTSCTTDAHGGVCLEDFSCPEDL